MATPTLTDHLLRTAALYFFKSELRRMSIDNRFFDAVVLQLKDDKMTDADWTTLGMLMPKMMSGEECKALFLGWTTGDSMAQPSTVHTQSVSGEMEDVAGETKSTARSQKGVATKALEVGTIPENNGKSRIVQVNIPGVALQEIVSKTPRPALAGYLAGEEMRRNAEPVAKHGKKRKLTQVSGAEGH